MLIVCTCDVLRICVFGFTVCFSLLDALVLVFAGVGALIC